MSDLGAHPNLTDDDFVSAERQDLDRKLRQIPETRHFGLVYRSRDHRLDATIPYIQNGLEQGERCLYLTTDESREEVLSALSTPEFDAEAASEEGQIRVGSITDVLGAAGFDPDEIIEFLKGELEAARNDGFSGLRVICRVPWGLVDGLSFESVVEYQTNFGEAFGDGVVVLCQHDMRAVDDQELVDVVQIYPSLIYQGRVCENPFYTPPEMCSRMGRPVLRAERILETAHDLTVARDAIRRREQRVAVLNRVLRHNLRNEMNVIQSHAELIDGECENAEIKANLSKIRETTERLLDVAEDARRIEQIAENDVVERVPVNLGPTVDRAIDRAQTHYPEIDVERDFDPVWVEGREELELGFTELFKRLAESASGNCRIDIERAQTRAGFARESLVVRCRDGSLPDSEVETVSNGVETPLRHSSGLGLWLVNWIVEHSGGDLHFRPVENDQETIVITLPSANDAPAE